MKLDKIGVSRKQAEALRYLLDDTTKVVFFGGGANSGKSYLSCIWLLLRCMNFHGMKAFIARNKIKDAEMSILKTFNKVADSLDLRKYYKYIKEDNVIIFRNGSEIDILDMVYRPSDPYFERFGSKEYTLGVCEEVGEWHVDAYNVMLSRINRWKNEEYGLIAKMLCSCNPKPNWIRETMYVPYLNGTLPDNIKFVEANIFDNTYRDKGSLDTLRMMTNDAMFARLTGDWFSFNEYDQLIFFEHIQASLDTPKEEGFLTIGVDVARFGKDKSAICVMQGNTIKEIAQYQGLEGDELADEVMHFVNKYKVNVNNIAVDAGGVGAGLIVAMKVKYGVNVEEFQYGSSPKWVDVYENVDYQDLRTQMWWTLAEDIKAGKIRIEVNLKSEIGRDMVTDLTAQRYEIKRDKKLSVQPKDKVRQRINKSPDCGDAMIMANFMRYYTSTPYDERPPAREEIVNNSMHYRMCYGYY